MATAKSDDETDVSAHPLAENRPGVYVQVVAPRRRKKSKRSESASSSRPPAGKARGGVREETDARVRARRQSDPRVADSEENALPPSGVPDHSAPVETAHDLSASPSEAPTVVGRFEMPDMDGEPATEFGSRAEPRASTPGVSAAAGARPSPNDETDEDDGRQSGERPVDFDSLRAREGASDNSNQRPDLSGMSIPPPPRLPSFARGEEPAERSSATPAPIHSASLLDAPPTLRPGAPESTPAARSSATLLAFVAAFTAIIVTAGLVALRELAKGDDPAPRARAVIAAPAQSAPIVAPAQPAAIVAPAQPAIAAPAQPAVTTAPAQPASISAPVQAAPVAAQAPRVQSAAGRPAKKAAPGRALVAKANAALRQLANTGLKATPEAAAEEPAPAAEEEERAPNPDEPLELPVNPY